MTTLKDLKEATDAITHASQAKGVIGMLVGYLQEAGVQTPAEKEQAMNEQRHRQVAQAQTVEELDAVVEGWGADFRPDGDLERAVDQRDAYLREQEAAAQADQPQDTDYASKGKTALQGLARDRGLAVSGSKEDLVDRLTKDDQARQAEADEAANAQQ